MEPAHTNNGIRSRIIPEVRGFPEVLIKFTAPKIPLRYHSCREVIKHTISSNVQSTVWRRAGGGGGGEKTKLNFY